MSAPLSAPAFTPTFTRPTRLGTAVRPRLLRLRCVALLALLQGCLSGGGGAKDAGPDAYVPGAIPGALAFGAPCEVPADCMSTLCLPVAGNLSVCTEACEKGAADEVCPDTDSWLCAGLNDEPVVCRCRADNLMELCADGVDNDCDGKTDDCQQCNGDLVGPDDPFNCGDCGTRCTTGATCDSGTCVCEDGSRGDACLAARPAVDCATDRDCDDGIDCTEDACNGFGQCLHTAVPARCQPGEVCDLLRGGCQPGRACASDVDCGDTDACTSGERCDRATRVCLWAPLDGDRDGQPPRVCGGHDCNDDQASTFSGAPERCDGIDNDCDGVVDRPLAADACPADRRCEGGSCRCLAGTLECLGACIDPGRDERHCGACGNVCVPGASCQAGACVCPDGQTECGGGCVDLQADAFACGACGVRCNVSYETCEAGVCADIDECEAGTDNCGAFARCVDRAGGFDCECEAGYEGPGVGGDCTDIDECVPDRGLCFQGRCVNSPGSYSCLPCPDGYMGDGATCQDVAECEVTDCGSNASCQELEGSYRCDCEGGYVLDDSDTCVQVGECPSANGDKLGWCGGACVDLLSSVNHCGRCGAACVGATCVDGVCGGGQ